MNDFVFSSPTKFVFGAGTVDRVGNEAAFAGYKKVLLVYGQGSVVRTGTLDRVKRSLEHAGIAYAELGGVRPNPEIELVRAGIKLAKDEEVDAVLPVGGGSAMDCAKAVALGVCYNGDIWDFWCKRAVPESCLPIIAVVTIPASGSEASNSCVITNDAQGRKCGCNSELIRPAIAVLDPELTFSLPPYQTAAGVTDIIAHVLERFFSGEPAVEITDNIACGIVRAVMGAASRVLHDPSDYDARAEIMWAGTLAHNGLAGCGLGIPGQRNGDWSCHALEHELSALDPSIAHGAGLAVMIPTWMRYVWHSHPERFLTFGKLVFGIEPVDPEVDDLSGIDEEITIERAECDAVNATIDELQDFFLSMGMPQTLDDLGISASDIDRLVDGIRINKGEALGTFKTLDLEDVKTIYGNALQ